MINLKMAPRIAMHNKGSLSLASECACYACLRIFPVKEIKEWTDTYDFRRRIESPQHEHTAICPYCSVDAILPINLEEDKDLANLKKIRDYWL